MAESKIFVISELKLVCMYYNHLISQCKFNFCWVCFDSWKKHSLAKVGKHDRFLKTSFYAFAAMILLTFYLQIGYFCCNRYEAMNKADEKQVSMISKAGQRNKQLQVFSNVYFFVLFING